MILSDQPEIVEKLLTEFLQYGGYVQSLFLAEKCERELPCGMTLLAVGNWYRCVLMRCELIGRFMIAIGSVRISS